MERETSVIFRFRVPAVWYHDDRCIHIRMQVAVNLDYSGLVKLHCSSLACRIVTQVELFRAGERKYVVKDRIGIGKRYAGAYRNDHELRLESLALLCKFCVYGFLRVGQLSFQKDSYNL